MYGYNGKIVYVDLRKETIEIKDLSEDIAERFVGGAGLSAKLTDEILTDEDYRKLKENPFESINPLIFSTGPLTASMVPSSSRYCVTAISPLTGIWGESTSGGYFPVALRKSGFDAIIITGKAEQPKILVINDTNIEIEDAQDIWGKDTRSTVEIIRQRLGDEKVRIACIGKGGENLVKYGCIINDEGRAAGRCGLGAIMGDKKLKAIAIRGRNKIEYADSQKIKDVVETIRRGMSQNFGLNFFNHYGTLCYMDMGMVLGDVPHRYFTSTDFKAEYLTGRALKEKYPVLNYNCAGCTVACGRTTIMEKNGEEIEIDGPEYETAAAFGPLCDILDWDPILECNHLCNLESVDTISAGVSIAFLLYLADQGLASEKITPLLKDLKYEELKFGNSEVVIKLLEKTINREGIGDVLAEGTKRMAEILDVDPELAAHVKGLEVPMHDPRAYALQALAYMICNVGASHEKPDIFNIEGDTAKIPGVKTGDRFTANGKEKGLALYWNLTNLWDSAVICNFSHIQQTQLARLLEASTGFKSLGKKRGALKAGERGNQLKRIINCKLGISRKDDKLPKIVSKTLKSGAVMNIELSLEDNLKNFYEQVGWDWKTGVPKQEIVEKLNI
ncbi:MAG: aldehyde ferredoxin oxidoreductase [Candidatus Lokiarchaeota archaeon]|nr:aldehyde ferredoxin oxidoreductase [Candidatus Lokiarchaeota archaeon]MBD3340102.1 aldehyde ferredoxin oxidoreductase [Candidatus Lokiarchaeota archaeon]